MMDGKVDQDVREAAAVVHAKWHDDGCPDMGGATYEEDVAILAFAAGRQAGLREAAEVVESLPWAESRVGNANFDDTKEYAAKAITALIEPAP